MATKATKRAFHKWEVSRSNITQLLGHYGLKEGQTVYTVKEVSPSGLTSYVRLFITAQDLGQPADIVNITHTVAQVLGWPTKERNGKMWLVVSGGGMDMSFHTVYSLSAVLFAGQERAGYALHQREL